MNESNITPRSEVNALVQKLVEVAKKNRDYAYSFGWLSSVVESLILEQPELVSVIRQSKRALDSIEK
jgi:hypothetical protein